MSNDFDICISSCIFNLSHLSFWEVIKFTRDTVIFNNTTFPTSKQKLRYIVHWKLPSYRANFSIGPLHFPVAFYRINYAGTQTAQWYFQHKGTFTSPARLSFPSFESPTALFASQYWRPLLSGQIKDKVITLANHKGHWQSSEPIKLQANTCRWRKARETVRWWVTIGLVLHLMDLESGARFFVNRLTQQSKAKACENYFKQKPQNINGREKYLRLDVYQTAARMDKKGKD